MGSPSKAVRSVRADMAERTERAWMARVAGATWEQAANVAGYTNGSNCRRAVMRVYGQLPRVKREDLRHLWRERLERLWRQALQDAGEKRPGAITAAVRLEQAAAALDGLNAPSQVELYSPSQHELDAFVAAVLAQRHQYPEEGDIFAVAVDAEVVEDSS